MRVFFFFFFCLFELETTFRKFVTEMVECIVFGNRIREGGSLGCHACVTTSCERKQSWGQKNKKGHFGMECIDSII